MKFIKTTVIVIVCTTLAASYVFASHKGAYPVKRDHGGVDIRPGDAYALVQKDSQHSFVVDVRTRFEYQDIGHPQGAYNIPLLFYTNNVGSKGYEKVMNNNFCRDLKQKFDVDTDSLFFICRSAERSTIAVDRAIECGFHTDKVYKILGGFEGDKVHEQTIPFKGKRLVSGWGLAGLPWTYSMKPAFMYQPDIRE